MIDTWFKKDLDAIFDSHRVAVFVDESKQSEFLIKTLDNSFKIYKVSGEIQELQAKLADALLDRKMMEDKQKDLRAASRKIKRDLRDAEKEIEALKKEKKDIEDIFK